MATNTGNREADERQAPILGESEGSSRRASDHASRADVVFDFTNVHHPDFSDLSLILTARLQAGPQDRVWVRALPPHTWYILRALGLDHLFRDLPSPTSEPN
jgi:hypothetical protein